MTSKLGSMQHNLRMNDLLRTLLKRLRRRWTFGLADIEQSSGELVVKKASTTKKHLTKSLEVSFDTDEENLKTLVEKRMMRKHCMPTTKRKLALAKFGNRKVLQSPQRLDVGWPPGRAGHPWEPGGNPWQGASGSPTLKAASEHHAVTAECHHWYKCS